MITAKFGVVVACLFPVLIIVGCGSSYKGPVSVNLSPQSAYLGSGQTLQFTVSVMNDTSGVTWSVSASSGAAGAGAAAGSVDTNGNFTAPTVTQNSTVTITATSVKDNTKSASATITIIAPGVVTTTANAQVALYTITVPDGLSASIQFSTDTSYGLTTWAVPAPSGGGAVPILVAGMKGNTQYHMRASFEATGTTTSVFTDVDHTFTTTAYPAGNLPSLATSTATGQTPQSGVELLDLLAVGTTTTKLNTVITDLSGNILWAYDPGSSVPAVDVVNPIKLLPNGHFLIVYSSAAQDGANSVMQEIDLAGNVVWQMTAAQLNAALAASTCAGCNITVLGNHHDFAILPNGHLIIIAATQQSLTLTGNTSPTAVLGDVIIDLDQNHKPVWLWNSFDHLDVNRHPMAFPPDWTHTNAVVYSPDDKALMISMRHQAWILKINYNDGAGDGSILWKLGYQGDFALQSGTYNSIDPQDWFNAQHDPNIISTTTAGTLDVMMFDNGNQRVLQASPLVLCGTSGAAACESRVPVIHLDENAKTADVTWLDKLDPLFSFFGGNARLLANGNIEFDECAATPLPNDNAAVFEVTKTNPPTTVWTMQITGQYAYRVTRIGSLYPGVQW